MSKRWERIRRDEKRRHKICNITKLGFIRESVPVCEWVDLERFVWSDLSRHCKMMIQD